MLPAGASRTRRQGKQGNQEKYFGHFIHRKNYPNLQKGKLGDSSARTFPILGERGLQNGLSFLAYD
jgi:hypothetical protein